jgi:AraC-like DNA-binding protein
MEYLGRTPPPPLDRFIERIWYCADTSSAPGAPAPPRARVIPSGGTLDLGFNLAEDDVKVFGAAEGPALRTLSGGVVFGPSTRSYFTDPRQRACAVGVHFRPGAAFAFLGISPAEIVDAHVDLHDVWGRVGRSLRDQLLEASSPAERLRIVEAALLRRLQRARPQHPAVGPALVALRDGGSDLRVARVASHVGLSHRRFVQVFEREVGVTPKLFARLQRFHSVKKRIATLGGPPSWAEFAIEHGYFDQSHMLRDFADFSGMSPAAYLRTRNDETSFDHLIHAYREGS